MPGPYTHAIGLPVIPTLALSPLVAGLFPLVLGSSMLSGALFFEHGMGLAPCVLCIYQRLPWVALIGVGALTIMAHRQSWAIPFVAGASGVIMAASTVLAVFHVGVEQHWWAGMQGCSAPPMLLDPNMNLDSLRDMLMAAPPVPCDEIAWSLFGVSMAGYNAVISAGLMSTSCIIWLWTVQRS